MTDKDKYLFKPYNIQSCVLFEREKESLLRRSPLPLQIEHIGSSAVKGLGGKGIIDLLVGIEKSDLQRCVSYLEEKCYIFREVHSTDDRFFFKRSDHEYPCGVIHLHLCCKDSSIFQDLLFFRDFLDTHQDKQKEYEEIKKLSSKQETYRKNKQKFIENILKLRN